ncbi:MAG: ATP-dependent DNA helicase RecG [Bdellovibrionales bacterium GWB1_55_8]|nr:MAG: ATP-dependent DNA helicase RecG [Bdellovibrionales bacterium GWB1_55_8]
MLPKVKSATTSSRSSTAERASGPATPIQYVKGVGPKLGALLASRGIATVKDILHFFPRAYEDRTRLLRVSELKDGEKASTAVRVLSSRKIPTRFGKSILEVRTGDTSGTLSLKWFHAPRGMESRFLPGIQIIVTGSVKSYMGRLEIVHPEITWNVSTDTGESAPGAANDAAASEAGNPNMGRVVPVYTEIEGITSRVLRRVLWEAVEKYITTLSEDLPERFLRQHSLPPISESIRTIHFPPDSRDFSIANLVEFNDPAHWRLIYEEFFKFEYLVLRQRLRMEKDPAATFGLAGGLVALKELESLLPFKLTRDQERAVSEILADLAEPHPMNRLIQGDVGSGKTAVAFLAASCVLAEGGQVALMAPTEILAEQHHRSAIRLFGGKLKTALLTGKTTNVERASLHARLAAGEPLLLIGTHAILEEIVQFKNLAFTLIDEQHRFGVEQRRTLRHKGTRLDPKTGKNIYPHTLVLSATPIPRTLALTAYGDLSLTSIRELPPGRSPVKTKIVSDRTERNQAYEQIRRELAGGRQAYFIYPLVNESEAEGFTQLKSVVVEAERLANEVFPEFRVGLLHGQMKPEEKALVMDLFQRNEIQLLVSTTVVEVGVDVPNATVIAIEHAERFGLSQLHQLRGRVGRGSWASTCFLFTHAGTGATANQRLGALERTTDGFEIAEADLEIRGPGEFLGTRQAGTLPFRLANLVRDKDWLIKARNDAAELLKFDPELTLPEHVRLRNFYEREGSIQFDRLKTS